MYLKFDNEEEAELMNRLVQAGAKSIKLTFDFKHFDGTEDWVGSCRTGFFGRHRYACNMRGNREQVRRALLEALLVAVGVRHPVV